MANYDFGLIGTGRMGSALLRSLLKVVPGGRVVLSNRTRGKAEALAGEYGCAVGGNDEAAAARYILLGVKPQMMPGVLEGVSPVLRARKDRFVLISMAAGLSMARIAEMAGVDCPVIRIMPNTPVEVGQGVVMMTRNAQVTDEERDEVARALAGCGLVDAVDEGLIDAGSAISGCGPAFVSMFIEALADGAVACGFPRAKAMAYAAMTLKGTAELMMKNGDHPGAMKDAVCSPGGSTIRGVQALENAAFRGACMNAVIAAYDKTKDLGRIK